MAENRRDRPQYSDDAYSPQNEPSDPLAELARLIGQGDPFTDSQGRGRKPPSNFRADDRPAPDMRAAPEWLSRPSAPPAPSAQRYSEPPRYQDQYDDAQPAQEHYADYQDGGQGGYQDQAYQAQAYQGQEYQQGQGYRDQAYPADDRYRVTPPPPADYDDGYYAEDGHMPPNGEESYAPPRRRGGFVTVAAVIGLAVIGTAGALAYRSFTGSGGSANPPLIKADPSPAKIAPPTSQASADNKPFQDRIGDPGAERVVPREEQPVSLPVPPRPTVAAPQTAFAPSPGASNAAPLVPPPQANPNEPKRVRTEIIRPSQDRMAATDSAPQAAPAPAAVPRAAAGRQAAPQAAAPMTIAPQSDAAPSSRTKVASRTPPAATGSYVVQVSAQKTEDEARSSYQALQQKYPNVLGGREATIRRADLPNQTWYRVQVGTFATSEQASTFCNSLKDAGGQCIVQKN